MPVMPAGGSSSPSSSEKDGFRKRKAHRKSRQGCGNCKLRRVKCDERQPQCERCIAYGVACSYDKNSSDLQLSASGALMLELSCVGGKISLNRTDAPSMERPLRDPSLEAKYVLNSTDLEMLAKFQTRTVYTIGTAQTCHLYKDVLNRLVFSVSRSP